MLTRSEASVVERDRGLKGLRALLDPEEFLAALRPCLPARELRSARRTYLRYKPGVNCLAAYELETRGDPLIVYGKTYSSDSPVKLAKNRSRAGDAAHHVLYREAMSVSMFPHDGKLSALSRLATRPASRSLLGAVFSDDLDVEQVEIHPIRYKPERRYVARLDADGAPWCALKIYTPAGYREARRPALGFLPGQVLRVPELVGKSDRQGTIATRWLSGRPLSESLLDPSFEVANLATVGAALAELHGQQPKGLLARPAQGVPSALRSLAEFTGFLVPELASRSLDLAARLTSSLVETPASWSAVHGDFYAKQVLLDGDRVALLDLDQGARADPASDLGLFVAHLERDGLRGTLAPERIEALTCAFLEGYAVASGRRLPVALHTALGLFQLLHHPFRHCEPDWVERTESIISRAEKILSGAEPSKRAPHPRPQPGMRAPEVLITDRFGVTNDPKMPFLAEALEPGKIEQQLTERLLLGQPLRVCAARVTRHKPGRRCVIEYDLELQPSRGDPEAATDVGKARARGLDKHAYQTLRALHRAGLAGERTSVPEPLGTVPPWNMWLQRKVPGIPATELLAGPDGPTLAERIAEAIHGLHAAKVPSPRRHGMADELRILHERLDEVAVQVPTWAGRIRKILEASDRLADETPPSGSAGIHRDFYSDHVIVHGDRLTLIDLDLYCEGDPALDVGNFSAHMIEYGLRVLGDPHLLDEARAALEERFIALGGGEIRRSLRAYTSLTLARHIHISTLLPKRRPFTERLLELSEELLLDPERS